MEYSVFFFFWEAYMKFHVKLLNDRISFFLPLLQDTVVFHSNSNICKPFFYNMIKKFIKDMNQSKGKPFSITLNIQTAPKNYIFAEWMSFSNWKLEYGTQVLPYSLWKLECLCLNILSNTTELEKRSKLMRPVWTWGFVAPTFMS